ncbi:MAG: HisA/HisF-related TIM barrel protein [Chromatiaceae bacterium]
MKLIPVIDVKAGQVVAAKMGRRTTYAPLFSPIARSSRLDEVTSGLLKLHPFDTLYIADLDAISGSGSHLGPIRSLHLSHPALNLWVDSGLVDLEELSAVARPVLGSESLASASQLTQLCRSLPSPILSLDFGADGLIGPADLDREPSLWPHEVIVMTLSRVGSDSGPDVTLLQRLLAAAPAKRLYAAGGIRHLADLQRLSKIGAAGALIATALHSGRISPTDIRGLGI